MLVTFNVVLGPIIFVSKCVGLFPYTLSGEGSRFVRIYSVVAKLTLMVLVGSSMFYDIFLNNLVKSNAPLLARIVYRKSAFLVNMGLSLYWSLRQPGRIQKSYRQLKFYTTYLGVGGYTWFNIVVLVLLAPAYSIVPFLAGFSSHVGPLVAIVGFAMPLYGNNLIVTQFFAFLEVLQCNFRKLNAKTVNATNLELCVHAYAHLCEMTEELNRIFGIHLMLTVVELLVTLITQFFQLFGSISNQEPYPGFLSSVPWYFVTEAVQIWSLCHVCYELHYESDIFTDVLCRAMRAQYTPCYNRKLLLHLAMRPSAEVSAGGFFTVNTSVLTSVLATSMTYFIVLVQLS